MADTGRKSIILVDFDNIFTTLWKTDRDLATQFGREPQSWLAALAGCHPDGVSRRWLVARCYLNPNGSVPGIEAERVPFWRFRAPLVRAGFEIVDCPGMRYGGKSVAGKNAADIRIVIDALDLLAAEVRYDEFVIASGDSDFAPLLHRIRARDRGSLVVVPGQASPAYTALADAVIGYDAFATLIRGDAPAMRSADAPLQDVVEGSAAAFASFVQARYAAAAAPLNISRLAQEAEGALPGSRASQWFGARSFSVAVTKLNLPNAAFSLHHLWDELRHTPPSDGVAAKAPPVIDMPVATAGLMMSLGVPTLSQDVWPQVFRTLAAYAASHDFTLTEATRWCRDSLSGTPHPVGRDALSFVVKGLQLSGAPLDRASAPSAGALARSFVDYLLDFARAAGITVDATDEAAIAAWLGIDTPEEAG